MKKLGVAVALAAGTLLMAAPAFAQNQHRQGQGQAIVTVLPAHEGEQAVSVALQDVKVKINGKQSSVTSWTPLRGPDSRIELVLLIDSGASRSLGEEMGELSQPGRGRTRASSAGRLSRIQRQPLLLPLRPGQELAFDGSRGAARSAHDLGWRGSLPDAI
jgi:hypothetical protein